MEKHPSGQPQIELEGNASIVIAGKCVILLYSEAEMRIRCEKLVIQIAGDGLELRTLDADEVCITGLITSVGLFGGEAASW